MHNHSGGDLTPPRADVEMTRVIIDGARLQNDIVFWFPLSRLYPLFTPGRRIAMSGHEQMQQHKWAEPPRRRCT
jgi:hypothetical protein